MGLILDIVNNVVPKVQERVAKGEGLKEVLAEELEKEIAHSLPDQSIENKHNKIFNDIIPPGVDIDHRELYFEENRQTFKDLI